LNDAVKQLFGKQSTKTLTEGQIGRYQKTMHSDYISYR
jgi:hypothetical protein